MKHSTLLPALMLILISASCSKHKKATPAKPELHIAVIEAQTDSVPQRMTFIGELDGYVNAVIEPRISGYLLSKNYKPGTLVKRGTLIYTIDDNLLRTSLLSAQASLDSAIAQELTAKSNFERAIPLTQIEAISQSELDQYRSTYAAARASTKSARESLRQAQLQVSYTRIYAPISGIIADSDAQIGDYVGVGTQFQTLTTISQIDTMIIGLSIPVSTYKSIVGVKAKSFDNSKLLSDITLYEAGNVEYPYPGSYYYTQKNVAQNMGSIVVWVKFPNPDESLKPGAFGRVKANVGPAKSTVVIPQGCVNQVQDKNSVWVIKPDSTAEYRPVTLGSTYGTGWCIESGIEAGEMIALDGVQKLQSGEKVIPQKNNQK